ncbi:hypothetical protein AGMMS49525_00580 [Bacteroidia bacterium]|nr:hypothetical protein AGMMS49525_00580 [Bacteroidia bacterium]
MFVSNEIIYFKINNFSTNFIECISAFLPFSPFVIYLIITYRYNCRRHQYINKYCEPKEREIKVCIEKKQKLDTYLEIELEIKMKE